MFLLQLVLAATVQTGQMAALIGNDRVIATYPGFRRDPGDATALAAVGMMHGEEAVVIRKVEPLSPTIKFTQDEARRIALSHLHSDYPEFMSELSREVLAVRRTSVCGRSAYGFVVKRKMSLHVQDGSNQEWTEADTYVLALVGHDLWQAEYERTYGPNVDQSLSSLVTFTGNFCVQQDYRHGN